MTWARDFSCNDIRCKNYKVKIDADTEDNFCEFCAAEVEKLGLCLSCGVEKVSSNDSILFPWLCEKCEAAAKAELFRRPLSVLRNRRRPVRQRYEPITSQLPRPLMTFWIIALLLVLLATFGTNGQFGVFLMILTSLFILWLPISVISKHIRDRRIR